MESKTLTIIKAGKHITLCSSLGRMFQPAKAFHFLLVLSCILFCLTTCEPCSVSGMPKMEEYEGCEYYGDNHHVSFQETIDGDIDSGYDTGTSMTHLSIESICTDSHSFCFPSTLPGFSAEESKLEVGSLEVSRSQSDSASSFVELSNLRGQADNKSWLSNHGMFKLLNGRMVSCSLYSTAAIHEFSTIPVDGDNQNDISSCRGPLISEESTSVRMETNREATDLGSFDALSSPSVDISPPIMDWGHRYLFLPSVAYLTVANTCNNSILHVYEPFSTNIQFYPCNFSEVLLGPGEVASICFIFLPRWLGLSSAHLILQTSSGGFLVQARGFALESQYKVRPLVSLDIPSSGQLRKNMSLFNPFDETLYVEEITAWISVSLGNSTHHTEAVCSTENFQGYKGHSLFNAEDWLVMNGGNFGFPLMAMRPNRNWDINPQSSETIIEIDLSSSEGKIFGAFCVQLWRSSQDISDIIMVPLEVDFDGKASHDDNASSLSVSLDPLVPHDGSETIFVAISLKNAAPYVLSIVKISEVAETKIFHIKYMERLLLFPGATTQIAVISCAKLPVAIHDSASQVFNTIRSCKLLIMTNDSISPQIEVSCEDIVHICVENQKDLSVGYKHLSEKVKSGNTRTGSLGDGLQLASTAKVLQTAEGDELVLGNWKSHGTTGGMSVLDDLEVLFPMVQIGSHFSKWITVKNPSKQPVVMQLILNSGEIVDECRSEDDFMNPPSNSWAHSSSAIPMKYGFSIGQSALTEAYVHPYGRASFGPILFHPSDRCGWRSSALIRNNLSGVEWLSLRGFGGSVSLVLLEGSEPIHSVEFNINLPNSLNVSPPQMFFHMEETTYACSQPFSKELYAKNTGDLPLEVRGIEVSGKECVVDGFTVHSCKGFSLEPGESTKLLISYQPDFSTAMVHRDLELALVSGVLVIPMKATLPVHMLNLCKSSVFWMRIKKLSIAVLLSASLLFLICCFIFHQAMVLGSHDIFYKSEKNLTTANKPSGKSSRVNRNQRNSKFTMSAEMDGSLSSVGDAKALKEVSNGRCRNGQVRAKEQGLTDQNEKLTPENDRKINSFLDPQREISFPSLPSKSAAADNPDTKEAPQAGNLTIRTGKEKGRRRRKRKGVFKDLFEVSSSQSGNSTPSSPLSPITSVTPNRTWLLSPDADQSIEVRNPFTQLAGQNCEIGKVSEPISKADVLQPKVSLEHGSNNWYSSTQEQSIIPSKPLLLPSATFPSAVRGSPGMLCSSSPLASTAVIAPRARAPGSKLSDQKIIKAEKKGRLGDEHTYDIWGDHFSGLHLIGSSKNVIAMDSSATEIDSDSFFVRGPQTLMKKSQPKFAFDKGSIGSNLDSKTLAIQGENRVKRVSALLSVTFATKSMHANQLPIHAIQVHRFRTSSLPRRGFCFDPAMELTQGRDDCEPNRIMGNTWGPLLLFFG